jgi:hypothetical protein
MQMQRLVTFLHQLYYCRPDGFELLGPNRSRRAERTCPCPATTEHSHAHARHVRSTDQTESQSSAPPRTQGRP